MTLLGEWLKHLPPLKAALGFLTLAGALFISVGASVVTGIGIPARTTALEETVSAMEGTLEHHIEQDSAATARIYCVVEAVWNFIIDEDSTPISPLKCDNTGGDQ